MVDIAYLDYLEYTRGICTAAYSASVRRSINRTLSSPLAWVAVKILQLQADERSNSTVVQANLGVRLCTYLSNVTVERTIQSLKGGY